MLAITMPAQEFIDFQSGNYRKTSGCNDFPWSPGRGQPGFPSDTSGARAFLDNIPSWDNTL